MAYVRNYCCILSLCLTMSLLWVLYSNYNILESSPRALSSVCLDCDNNQNESMLLNNGNQTNISKNKLIRSSFFNNTLAKHQSNININENIPVIPQNKLKKPNSSTLLTNLLFDNASSQIYKHFMLGYNNASSFLPFNLEYFRESTRSIYGDVSHLRYFLNRVINEKKCIYGWGFGGSVTYGHGIPVPQRKNNLWTDHLAYYLNTKYPCKIHKNISGEIYDKHIIQNHGGGGHSTSLHFYDLPNIFSQDGKYYNKWVQHDCSNIDIIIFESSVNDVSYREETKIKVLIYTELFIRHILKCRTEILLIYLHIGRHGRHGFESHLLTNIRISGDYLHQNALHYYKIPTIGLTDIMYPLSYRLYSGIDNDQRFNDTPYGKHLLCDKAHPCSNAHKYFALLIAYLFCDEYNKMMETNDFELQSVYNYNILPPLLYKYLYPDPTSNRFKAQYELFNYFANNHFVFASIIGFDDIKIVSNSKNSSISIDNYFNQYLDGYNVSDLCIEILPKNSSSSWKLIVENEDKLGFIGENINNELSFRILWKKNMLNAVKYFRKLFCSLLYLTSYENMGMAKIWITDSQNQIISDIHKIDGLVGEHVSVYNEYLFEININQTNMLYEYYFHIKIIKTNKTRIRNKFKIIKVTTIGM